MNPTHVDKLRSLCFLIIFIMVTIKSIHDFPLQKPICTSKIVFSDMTFTRSDIILERLLYWFLDNFCNSSVSFIIDGQNYHPVPVLQKTHCNLVLLWSNITLLSRLKWQIRWWRNAERKLPKENSFDSRAHSTWLVALNRRPWKRRQIALQRSHKDNGWSHPSLCKFCGLQHHSVHKTAFVSKDTHNGYI
jgi:hypothetical protein